MNREEFNKKVEAFTETAYEFGITIITLCSDTLQEIIDFIKKYSKKEVED